MKSSRSCLKTRSWVTLDKLLHRTNTLKKILKSIQRKSFKGKLYRTVQAEALYKFSTKGPYTPRPLYNLGTSLKELAEPWRIRRDRLKPPTQRLGAVAATSERFQGILFNSIIKSGNCMVIFTDKIIAPYFIQINDPEGNLIGQLP